MAINNFGPFNAEVWGTVSDWVVVAVTTTTAFFIYRTFRSQISVQRNQQYITDIEGERFRIEYKPKLQLGVQEVINKTEGASVKSNIRVFLSIVEKDCKNLNIETPPNTSTVESVSISKDGIGLSSSIDYVYAPNNYNLHFKVSSIAAIFPYEGGSLFFFLHFEDIIGNRYRQEYRYIFKEQLEQTFTKNPERLLKQEEKSGKLWHKLLFWQGPK